LHRERRERCLIVIETLPLKERYKKEELKLEFVDLALACFNRHSIKSVRYKNTRIQLGLDNLCPCTNRA